MPHFWKCAVLCVIATVSRMCCKKMSQFNRSLCKGDLPETLFFFLPANVREDNEPAGPLPQLDQEAMELLAAFQQIADEELRKSLLSTIKAAAAASAPNS